MMSRRAVLGGLGAAMFSGEAQETQVAGPIKPKALKQGDTGGLITPSTAVTDPEDLIVVERTVRHFGLVPKWGKNVTKRAGHLGGAFEERLGGLPETFAAPR